MGLFHRKNKKDESEGYQISEDELQNLKENGVDVEVAVGIHGNDELIAGAMLGETGKLIAMNNYGKLIYKSTKLFFLDEGIRIKYNGEFFDHHDIYQLEKRKISFIHAEFAFITSRGEILLKATNHDFLACMELFRRSVAEYSEKLEEKNGETEKSKADVDLLIELGELYKSGLLSYEEFEEAKKKLI